MSVRANMGARRRCAISLTRRNYEATRHLLRHLGWAVDIFWASIMGDRARAQALLAEDETRARAATAADHILGAGLSPLHLAAQGGHLETMALLHATRGRCERARC